MGDISMPLNPLSDMEVVDLATGWSFKRTDDVGDKAWNSVKKIPSTVHQDLIDCGRYVYCGRVIYSS